MDDEGVPLYEDSDRHNKTQHRQHEDGRKHGRGQRVEALTAAAPGKVGSRRARERKRDQPGQVEREGLGVFARNQLRWHQSRGFGDQLRDHQKD